MILKLTKKIYAHIVEVGYTYVVIILSILIGEVKPPGPIRKTLFFIKGKNGPILD